MIPVELQHRFETWKQVELWRDINPEDLRPYMSEEDITATLQWLQDATVVQAIKQLRIEDVPIHILKILSDPL
jgi:hypothetical protein